MNDRTPVRLEPWSEQDLPLLEKLLGDADMMQHLGGPETPEQIANRHQRYLHLPESDRMFSIHLEGESQPVGSIGFWEKHWRDQLVYETGWSILASHQGRGIATLAGRALIPLAQQEHRYRYLHAFPSVENTASNAICQKLGFVLLEACDFEYPPGNFMRCNDWRFDLFQEHRV
jgi:RimJ/RimL family protein N-acetyltransferase